MIDWRIAFNEESHNIEVLAFRSEMQRCVARCRMDVRHLSPEEQKDVNTATSVILKIH